MDQVFRSPIRLGIKYRDIDTQFEGVADQITFRRNGAPPRVMLRALLNGAPVDHWFDSLNLRAVDGGGVGFANVVVSEEMVR